MNDPSLKPARAADIHTFHTFDFMMAAFVAILLLSNVIGAGKVAQFHGYEFGAGILFFPLSYLLGDILTEVYGYARARRCIWAGFAAMLFMAFMSWVVVKLPPAAAVDRTGGLRKRVRTGSPHRVRLDRRVLGGRIRQFLRHGADENLDRRQQAVDSHRRLDLLRPGRGQRDLLSAGVPGSLAGQPGVDRAGHQLGAESGCGKCC